MNELFDPYSITFDDPFIVTDLDILATKSWYCNKSLDLLTDVNTVQSIIRNLWKTLEQVNAMGLSAIQIGFPVRIFVMRSEGVDYTCINPEIVSSSDQTMFATEGCVSFPGQAATTIRNQTINVRYQETFEGEFVNKTFSDMESICFQHEMDHLNGIVMFMRQSNLKKRRWLKKISKHHQKNRS